MTVEDLFIKGNKLFAEKKFLEGLGIYKEIYLRFPKNLRLYEEIKKKEKKYKKSIYKSYSKHEIEEFWKLGDTGHAYSVIKILTSNYNKNSNDILTISLLGNFYGLNKEIKKAIYFQQLAIQKAPFESVFYLNLHETLRKNNELEESLSILYFSKILSHRDLSIDHKIAKLSTSLKKYSQADSIYKGLIKNKKVSKDIIYSYCSNLIKLKKEKETILFIKNYEKNYKTDEILKSLIGLAYLEQKEYDSAENYFLQAIQLDNNNANLHTMLGDCYERMGKLDKAKNYYKISLKLDSNNKSTLNSLASLNYFNGNIDEAERLYKLSINYDENNHDAKYLLAQCQLAKSNYTEGWKNFESRWFSHSFNSRKLKSNLPKFTLNSENKNLLIWGEQGVGDQVLSLRFLRDVETYTENIFIKIDKRLHPIIKRSHPNVKFFSSEIDYKIQIDSQISLVELATLFLTENSYFSKNNDKYISGDNLLKKELKEKLKTEKIVCGLSWISKNNEIGNNKSITLEMLKPLLLIEGITFIDLQYNDTKIEKDRFFNDNSIKINGVDTIDNFNDLNGLTSLIEICDFVITVSNTNAHISGALGKKTFLLLPKGKGRLWYWSSKNNKSLWYPSIEVIEQNVAGSWNSAINKLIKLVKENLIG